MSLDTGWLSFSACDADWSVQTTYATGNSLWYSGHWNVLDSVKYGYGVLAPSALYPNDGQFEVVRTVDDSAGVSATVYTGRLQYSGINLPPTIMGHLSGIEARFYAQESDCNCTFQEVKMFKKGTGVIGSDEKSNSTIGVSLAYHVCGGANNPWGNAISIHDVMNNQNIGVSMYFKLIKAASIAAVIVDAADIKFHYEPASMLLAL